MRGLIHGYGSVTLSSNYVMVISPVTVCQKYKTQCRQCHLLVSGLTLLWSPSDWQHSLHSPIYHTEASELQSHQQPLLQYWSLVQTNTQLQLTIFPVRPQKVCNAFFSQYAVHPYITRKPQPSENICHCWNSSNILCNMTPTVHTEIHSRNLISVHISLIIMPTVHDTKIRLLLSFSKMAECKKHITNKTSQQFCI